jgi:hypothetical protein
MKGEREKPFGLDMPFNDALKRFIGVDPRELPDDARIKKKERPKPLPGVHKKAPKGTD